MDAEKRIRESFAIQIESRQSTSKTKKRKVHENVSHLESDGCCSRRHGVGYSGFWLVRAKRLAYFIAVPGPQGQQRHCHAQHEGRKERSHVVGRLCCSGYTRPTLAGCRFRRKRLSARQVEDQSVHRHELQKGNRSAELRKERQEGRDLVCFRGSKSR